MLLAYGARNCWGFRDWMEIDLTVNKNVSSDIAFPDKRVVPALCFEGANASGKTCALRVLSFIYDFCINSFLYKPDSQILFDTFFHNESKSDFFIKFCLNSDIETEYTYEAELDRQKVYREELRSRKGKDKRVLIRRKGNRIILNNLFPKNDGMIYRDNASFISTLVQYGVKEIAPFAEFFRNVTSNVSYKATLEDPMIDYAAEYYYEHPELHQRVTEQLKKWDTGIKHIEIHPLLNNQGQNIYTSVFIHENSSEDSKLIFSAESNGTKLLYNRLKDIFVTLDTGGVLIFDELDTHLHSDIVPEILRFFTDPKINQKNAQIIFSSHLISLLDILKKYRVYLFKKLRGESICYRIDELKGNSLRRNDRSLEQLYKSGTLGGLPYVTIKTGTF